MGRGYHHALIQGDVRRVQKLSRYANLDTLMIYDGNRLNHQGEITDLLAGLV